jgi:5-(carboxyamino)imidazole ribonucleotide synthase
VKVGILGGGQLAQMLAMAAQPLGISCTVYDPTPDPCAAIVCDHIRGEYDDHQSLYQLALVSDVITYEFENVPVESARWLAERLPVYPPPQALEVSQDRVTEKTFLSNLGIPTPEFAAIESRPILDLVLKRIGLPSVLKTRRFGYDGKGQAVLRTPQAVDTAWQALGGRPLILEGFVPFTRELSSIAVRSRTGEVVVYPLTENEHREGMLYRSLAPAPNLSLSLQNEADTHARRVLTELDYVGVLAIEWFEKDGVLIANEMAPRVHNSGHWSIEGAVTSQFENHIRAIAGFPLGSTTPMGSSVMFNWIGERHPKFEDVLRLPNAKLHWYGKEPRARRKIGHVTSCERTEVERDAFITAYENLIARYEAHS